MKIVLIRHGEPSPIDHKLTEKEMTKIVKNLSVELQEADISVQYYASCLKDYFSEKDSEV